MIFGFVRVPVFEFVFELEFEFGFEFEFIMFEHLMELI